MRTLQQEIINDLGVKPEIDPAEELEQRTTFLATYLGETGLKGLVLGISGGQDSLLAGIISQRAVERRRAAGHEATFHALLLPYGEQADRADALQACDVIGPDVIHDVDMKPGTDSLAQSIAQTEGHPVSDFDKGNIKARMRMIAHYAIAGEHKLLVVGTDHAAEAVTGFFTKFGDGGADVLPISGLTKRQGRQILEMLGVPEVFTTKKPTADLLDAKPGQADESELGITYQQIDDFLEGKNIADETAEKLEQRYLVTQHKRSVPVAYTA
jgi:NAD+ synthase